MKQPMTRGFVAILCLGLPLVLLNSYFLYLVSLAVVYYIAAAGTDVLSGYTDQLSLAGAAFFGLGAYTQGVLQGSLHLPWAWAMVTAMAVGLAGGLVIGLPALRVSHIYLGISTLTFVVILQTLFNASPTVMGGSQGLSLAGLTILGLPANDRIIWVIVWAFALAVFLVERNLLTSQYGRIFVALKDSEVALQSVGVSAAATKIRAFLLSSVALTAAGALYVELVGAVDPTIFDPNLSITILSMVVIGGSGWLWGPLVGALFVTLVPQIMALVGLGTWANLLYGVAFFLALRFAPEGLGRRFRDWLSHQQHAFSRHGGTTAHG